MRKGSNPLPPEGAKKPAPPPNPPASRKELLKEALGLLVLASDILEECRDRHEDRMAEEFGDIPVLSDKERKLRAITYLEDRLAKGKMYPEEAVRREIAYRKKEVENLP